MLRCNQSTYFDFRNSFGPAANSHLEQADALAEALADSLTVSEPAAEEKEDWVPPQQISSRSKTAAALFALFLGGVGIHRFYLGRPGTGMLYLDLVFFWTLIPAFIGFLEALVLLSMSEDDFAQRYA